MVAGGGKQKEEEDTNPSVPPQTLKHGRQQSDCRADDAPANADVPNKRRALNAAEPARPYTDAKLKVLAQVQAYAADYISTVNERRVFPSSQTTTDAFDTFSEPLPERGISSADALELLHRYGSPATVASTGGRYFGFVTGGTLPACLGARVLGDVWDQNNALHDMSPVSAILENVCERWVVDLLGLPENSAMGMVSGASMSILCGLAAGRNELLRRKGWSVAEKGLTGAPLLKVVVSDKVHATVLKALCLLGIGRSAIVPVPCDPQGRLDLPRVPAVDDLTMVVLAAGNVNTGSFDSFSDVPKWRSHGAWVHVDGAFGLWAAASPTLGPALCAGVCEADSWSADMHKTLNTPYDGGLVICRDRTAMAAALEASGPYMQFCEDGDPRRRDGMRFAPEMSRRARSIELWTAIKTLGREGVAGLVERMCERAQEFAEGFRQMEGFEVINDVVYNQVMIATSSSDGNSGGGSDTLTLDTLKILQDDGECWCGGSRWGGRAVIRVSVCSDATTKGDVTRSLEAFKKARANAGQRALSRP